MHHSLKLLFERQRRILNRVTSILFGIAGFFWIFVWFAPDVPPDTRLYQYMVYLCLMSVWGYDYLRQVKRLSSVVEAANSLDLPPNRITPDLLRERNALQAFVVIWPIAGVRAWYPPLFVTIMLCAATALIMRQYLSLLA